jgi:hypothetical protein
MWEYTSLVNEIFRLQIPYEVHVSGRFADAGFALFDAHSLMTDIFNNPSHYLNGTTPLDVTNPYHQCNITTGTCENATASFDSYYWYVCHVIVACPDADCTGGTKFIPACEFFRL